MNQDEYNERFETKNPNSDKLKKAFDQVSDMRKLEIDLYWKRAAYFWAFITVAFAGYFAILSSRYIPNKDYLSFIVTSIGFVFTFAWYLVNRGSKYWQENWENHLDLLEDEIIGPIYKTVLERTQFNTLTEKLVTGPLSVSASKINQWVGVFVLIIWILLAAYSTNRIFGSLNISNQDWMIIISYAIIVIVSIICCFFMLKSGRTDKGNYTPKPFERKQE